jgi:peptide/nickel transport system substrate-binding protein
VGGDALKKPEVRQAIRLALDYDGLVDVTVGGAGKSQPSPIPNGFAGTDGLDPPKQDVTKAKDLLSQAGETNLTFDATYPTFNVYGVDFSTAMQKVQTDLKAVGIELKLNPVEISVWADKIGKDGIPVTMLYFAPTTPIPVSTCSTSGCCPVTMADVGQGRREQGRDGSAQSGVRRQGRRRVPTCTTSSAQKMIDDQIIIPVVNPTCSWPVAPTSRQALQRVLQPRSVAPESRMTSRPDEEEAVV